MIVDALAVYRLTRLVVSDDITETPRRLVVFGAYGASGRAMGYLGEDATAQEQVASDAKPPMLAKLVTCPWCASIWIGFGVVLMRRLVPRVWRPVADALAMSAVAGFLSGHEHT